MTKEKQIPTDFYSSYTDEPHATRRKQILAAHPEVKSLFGPCPRTKWIVLLLVSAQISLGFFLRNRMWSIEYWLISYFVGATITHSLFLAIHEISHNLAFQTSAYNRMLGIFANIPIGFPYSVTFRGYHQEHHKYQGEEGVDTDLPTAFEANLFSSTLGKLFFCTFQILFYALRPGIVKSQKITFWHLINAAIQLFMMALLVVATGPNIFIYFVTCLLLSGSLHPMAGHFLAEHFVFKEGFETYSYYGPLNMLAFNVGYHNEHHDFPYIPGSRLPLLRKMAPEFYDDLPTVESWPGTIFEFISSPYMNPYCRVKRKVLKRE